MFTKAPSFICGRNTIFRVASTAFSSRPNPSPFTTFTTLIVPCQAVFQFFDSRAQLVNLRLLLFDLGLLSLNHRVEMLDQRYDSFWPLLIYLDDLCAVYH